MNTQELVTQVKARFSHNSSKEYLKQKYTNKLLVADQNGLWQADQQTISFLSSLVTPTTVLIDTFGNPVEVNRESLLVKLKETYETVMQEWYTEYKELENNR